MYLRGCRIISDPKFIIRSDGTVEGWVCGGGMGLWMDGYVEGWVCGGMGLGVRRDGAVVPFYNIPHTPLHGVNTRKVTAVHPHQQLCKYHHCRQALGTKPFRGSQEGQGRHQSQTLSRYRSASCAPPISSAYTPRRSPQCATSHPLL